MVDNNNTMPIIEMFYPKIFGAIKRIRSWHIHSCTMDEDDYYSIGVEAVLTAIRDFNFPTEGLEQQRKLNTFIFYVASRIADRIYTAASSSYGPLHIAESVLRMANILYCQEKCGQEVDIDTAVKAFNEGRKHNHIRAKNVRRAMQIMRGWDRYGSIDIAEVNDKSSAPEDNSIFLEEIFSQLTPLQMELVDEVILQEQSLRSFAASRGLSSYECTKLYAKIRRQIRSRLCDGILYPKEWGHHSRELPKIGRSLKRTRKQKTD